MEARRLSPDNLTEAENKKLASSLHRHLPHGEFYFCKDTDYFINDETIQFTHHVIPWCIDNEKKKISISVFFSECAPVVAKEAMYFVSSGHLQVRTGQLKSNLLTVSINCIKFLAPIDFTKMQKEESALFTAILFTLCKDKRMTSALRAGEQSCALIDEDKNEFYVNFNLKHSVYIRPSENDSTMRLEVYGQPFAVGAAAEVFKTLGTFIPMNDGTLTQSQHERIVKRQDDNLYHRNLHVVIKKVEHANSMLHRKNEVRVGKVVPHLHLKPLSFFFNESLSSAKFIAGTTLSQYLAQLEPNSTLSPQTLAMVLLAVIRAYESQVAAHDIVHRDIKADNFLLECGRWPIVHTLDYAFGKFTHETDDRIVGTPVYVAPEIRDRAKFMSVNTPLDIHSLGVLIAEMMCLIDFSKDTTFFPGMDELESRFQITYKDYPHAKLLHSHLFPLIASMCQQDPEKRATLSEIKQKLEIFYQACCSNECHDYPSEIFSLAVQTRNELKKQFNSKKLWDGEAALASCRYAAAHDVLKDKNVMNDFLFILEVNAFQYLTTPKQFMHAMECVVRNYEDYMQKRATLLDELRTQWQQSGKSWHQDYACHIEHLIDSAERHATRQPGSVDEVIALTVGAIKDGQKLAVELDYLNSANENQLAASCPVRRWHRPVAPTSLSNWFSSYITPENRLCLAP